MGSLMAGWDSPTSDPKFVKYKRNQSLTKEEIEAYWRGKKKIEEEHLKAISSPQNRQESSEINLQRSSSLPMANTITKESFMNMDKDADLEHFIKKNGWWTRSNWAFLNEPPVLEGNSKSYASQFHIANLAASTHS
ncbi:putative DNA polymerase epsilon catalytic subunit A [Melia azedarach]|uniref:DNA polymerase epsilon catalytic subunit A n=1 Tax=Melia azedarach TaxID=155640 RepID=A0ACC1WSE4_MELAZ|nr:putative DNA polymerase epsilon catalytic subunit A [Melia azedarach]